MVWVFSGAGPDLQGSLDPLLPLLGPRRWVVVLSARMVHSAARLRSWGAGPSGQRRYTLQTAARVQKIPVTSLQHDHPGRFFETHLLVRVEKSPLASEVVGSGDGSSIA